MPRDLHQDQESLNQFTSHKSQSEPSSFNIAEKSWQIAEGGKCEIQNDLAILSQSLKRGEEQIAQSESHGGLMAEFVMNRARKGCDGVVEYLENRSMKHIYQDITESVRKRPELALGGLFVGGIIVSRLLKMGARESTDTTHMKEGLEANQKNQNSDVPLAAPSTSYDGRRRVYHQERKESP